MAHIERRLKATSSPLRPPATTEVAVPQVVAGGVASREILGIVAAGAWRGFLLAGGAALAWALASPTVREPLPTEVVLTLLAGFFGGGAIAVVTRAVVPPFGRVRWGEAYVAAALLLPLGAANAELLHLMMSRKQGLILYFFVLAPIGLVYWDWAMRYTARVARRKAETGDLPTEKVQLIDAQVRDVTVAYTPVALAALGLVAGHVVAGLIASAANWPAGAAEVGGLIGRLCGVLLGLVAAVILLRLYRVEADRPWPWRGNRPCPVGLVALYVVTAAVLGVVLWRV
jgi:hypothetical protein